MESNSPSDPEIEEEVSPDKAPSAEKPLWRETEEAGDEREPFDGEVAEDSEPSPEPQEEEEEEQTAAQPRTRKPVEPEYPTPPCYVTVDQGDCVLSLAKRYRRLPEQIWQAPENSDLRQNRKQNVLLPGDRVFVPAVRVKELEGPTEKRHRFKVKGCKCRLRLRLLHDGEPRKQLPYELKIDSQVYQGTTDGNGVLEVKIPADAQQGTLTLNAAEGDEVHILNLGHLNPVEDDDGARARLRNLGYASLDDSGQEDAIAAFQRDEQLPVTGRLDDTTRSKLVELHGS